MSEAGDGQQHQGKHNNKKATPIDPPLKGPIQFLFNHVFEFVLPQPETEPRAIGHGILYGYLSVELWEPYGKNAAHWLWTTGGQRENISHAWSPLKGFPERGYFVLACVWLGMWAGLGSCWCIHACILRFDRS